jgi:hypothetical protein
MYKWANPLPLSVDDHFRPLVQRFQILDAIHDVSNVRGVWSQGEDKVINPPASLSLVHAGECLIDTGCCSVSIPISAEAVHEPDEWER